jgi:hypothetical protein
LVGDRSVIPPERIERSILLIRDQKVMLESDLAEWRRVEITICDLKIRPQRRNVSRLARRLRSGRERPDKRGKLGKPSEGGIR